VKLPDFEKNLSATFGNYLCFLAEAANPCSFYSADRKEISELIF